MAEYMSIHPRKAQPLQFFKALEKVKKRNKDLAARLAACQVSRDKWKAKAVARSQQNARLREKIRRLELRARPQRRPASFKRKYSAAELEQHRAIVRRIRAIPNREIQ